MHLYAGFSTLIKEARGSHVKVVALIKVLIAPCRICLCIWLDTQAESSSTVCNEHAGEHMHVSKQAICIFEDAACVMLSDICFLLLSGDMACLEHTAVSCVHLHVTWKPCACAQAKALLVSPTQVESETCSRVHTTA